MAPDEPPPRVPWLPVNEGAQPAAPAPAEELTPTKPPVPAWIRRDDVPQFVDDEDADASIVSPVAPPAANELLPRPGAETTFEDPPADTLEVPADPVQLLGETAVASAALSAGGAPTPLGGVPVVPADVAVDSPSFDNGAPLFTPRFVEGQQPDTPPIDLVADERARIAERASALDSGAAYEPRTFAEDTAPDHAQALPPRQEHEPASALPGAPIVPPLILDEDEAPPRRRSRWWIWVLVIAILVGGATAAYFILNKPEPLVIPGATVTEPPPAPTIEPTPAPTGSDFQAAMPTAVGTYALVEATPLDPTDVALGAGRIADGVDLTYRSGTDTMNVRALQYFNEADATEMFVHFAGEGAATQPVEAGGQVVGESAIITSPKPGMVWRNGTSLFIVTGPTSQIADFYAQFGL